VALLARMIASPLTVDVRRGAIAGLGDLLSGGGFSSRGKVAVLLGPGQGEELTAVVRPQLPGADLMTVPEATVDAARDLAAALRGSSYDAVVGIGGGRTLDVAKYVSSLVGLPMVSVATNLAHDGIASPTASLVHEGRKASYGVHIPLAVIVDLDYVSRAPQRMVRSGVGDVVSNLSALADWRLAFSQVGERVDGLAAAMAGAAANAVLYRPDSVESDDFLATLAEALILSGLAMAVTGTSRPCSGGDHEIIHAIDELFPDTSNHGELAGIGALFCTFLREDSVELAAIDACLRRHQLPRLPADVGLSVEQFTEAVVHAPQTRPDRYTILEHLALSPDAMRKKVDEYVSALAR
jgi:glycerol-1-phosphate dehydrogenase [NAD(P)+]